MLNDVIIQKCCVLQRESHSTTIPLCVSSLSIGEFCSALSVHRHTVIYRQLTESIRNQFQSVWQRYKWYTCCWACIHFVIYSACDRLNICVCCRITSKFMLYIKVEWFFCWCHRVNFTILFIRIGFFSHNSKFSFNLLYLFVFFFLHL